MVRATREFRTRGDVAVFKHFNHFVLSYATFRKKKYTRTFVATLIAFDHILLTVNRTQTRDAHARNVIQTYSIKIDIRNVLQRARRKICNLEFGLRACASDFTFCRVFLFRPERYSFQDFAVIKES